MDASKPIFKLEVITLLVKFLKPVLPCIINQSQNLCKDLLLKNTPKDEHDYFLTRFSILSALGFIIGPFISGSLFSIGFLYVGLLAAALTLANIFLIKSIPKGTDDLPPQLDERSFVEKSWENVIDTVDNFKKSDYKKNWDIIAIKYLYISSITIFFSKFTQILKHNFDATPFVIGYTSSYMSSLTFAGTYFATNIKDHISNYSVLTLTEYALVVAGTTQLLACYSPVYNLYAIMCIPIIFSTSFINSMWKDLFSIRGNESLKKVNSSVGILSGLTIPLIFGIVCNTIGHHAVIIFSVIPIIVSLFVINKYTKQYKLVEQENKKSKDE
ncbi:hypothetical protein NQ314_008427 [Rhamnusium bicolor]|uniref:Uncharacterized protein n=1 Tax=Rhamnusium bicolor TaxID=1586634 RepID=A0AAV8YAV6_9CUCU|nr:hypothetical protein NQ314_008427 [Rhamnusium bicolor]